MRLVAPLLLGLVLACAGDEPVVQETPTGELPTGGKFDTPTDPAEESCMRRRSDALTANRQTFTEGFLRWSCKDPEGVNTNNHDNRGQEYCEYFAIVQTPPSKDGDPLGESVKVGAIVKNAENLKDDVNIETTPLSVELSLDQIAWLETHPDETVGACVFTSWHTDVFVPVTNCWYEDQHCEAIYGIPMTMDNFKMKLQINTASAALGLIEKCEEGVARAGDPEREDDPLHDDFYRGCMYNNELNQTPWKKSDTSICVAVNRLRECGCEIEDGIALVDSLMPEPPDEETDIEDEDFFLDLRGFPLGGWDGPTSLPSGCEYANIGDGTNVVVTCRLTAIELLDHADEVKGYCADKYAENVVVHVPMPAEVDVCRTPEGKPYTNTCTDKPWLITGEALAVEVPEKAPEAAE